MFRVLSVFLNILLIYTMKKSLLTVISLLFLGIILANSNTVARNTELSNLAGTNTPITHDQNPPVISSDESVITNVVNHSLPSVVTIGLSSITNQDTLEIDPFNPFAPYRRIPGGKQNVDQNIGSGLIISPEGLIVTNKHVVSDDTAAYKVLTNDNKTYPVTNIYRDPKNDIAVLKINASGLTPLRLGDSGNLKLGQTVIAIGTPLGEFTNTVTKGIISGLGRGITAGSPYEGYVEKLDNVIQTDAPISPGNSGGPLLNSAGEVIGINTAIASQGQNIGFAIPSNVIKSVITQFNQ